MEKEKSKAVTTIDVLFDKAQCKNVKITNWLPLSFYTMYACVCPEPAWHAARVSTKTYMGLSQHRQVQDKQQQQPQPHDNWLRQPLYNNERGWAHSGGHWACGGETFWLWQLKLIQWQVNWQLIQCGKSSNQWTVEGVKDCHGNQLHLRFFIYSIINTFELKFWTLQLKLH